MGSNHSKIFFGQNTGLIVNSSSILEPFFFIRCIKKNPDGTWEKPSRGEGKVVKFSLEEIVMMLEVLDRKSLNWSSYHSFNDIETKITFEWEDDNVRTLWIKVDKYSKMLNFAQAEILRRLLVHILEEKIVHATVSSNSTIKSNSMGKKSDEVLSHDVFNEALLDTHEFLPKKKRKKAINDQQPRGIPKSTIHGKYIPKKNRDQKFLIDDWILKKNHVIS